MLGGSNHDVAADWKEGEGLGLGAWPGSSLFLQSAALLAVATLLV